MNKFIKRILGAATAVAVAFGSLGAVPGSELPDFSITASAENLSLKEKLENLGGSFSTDAIYELYEDEYTYNGGFNIFNGKEVNITIIIPSGRTLTIISSGSGILAQIANLTIKGGGTLNVTSSGTLNYAIKAMYGTITIDGVTVNAVNTDGYNGIESIGSGNSLTIQNGAKIQNTKIGSFSNGTTVTGSTLKYCTVSGAVFDGATIENCTVSGSKITGGTITGSTIKEKSTVDNTAEIKSSTVTNSTVDGEEVKEATYDENGTLTTPTVTFDLNGATGSIDSQNIASGAKATKPTADPTREGYTFKGWYDNPDCTGTAFDFANTAITANTTLYAKWLQHITYIDANGETQTCTEYTVLTGNETEDDLESGWYVVKDTLNYDHPLSLANVSGGYANLILCDDKTLNIGRQESPISAQIDALSTEQLTVYAQSKGTGALNIYNSSNSSNCIFSSVGFTQNGGNIRLVSEEADAVVINGTSSVMTINNGSLDITAGSRGIYSGHAVNINGGVIKINAKGTYSIECESDVNLSWTKPSDSITLNKGTNKMSQNKPFVIKGTNTLAYFGKYKGKTIVPACSFTTNIGEPIGVALNSDGTVTPPTTTINGLTFDGWYTDSNCTQKCAEGYFDSAVTDTTAFYGKYTVSYKDADNETQTITDFTLVTSSDTGVTWSAGNTYVVAGNAEITKNTTFQIVSLSGGGTVNLILCDGASLTIGGESFGGQCIAGNGISLNIYGQTGQTGKLTCTTTNNAIIADGLNIYGGDITAKGVSAIDADSGNCNIVRGKVNVTSTNRDNTAIKGDNITISGGNVTATNTAGGRALSANENITLDWTSATDSIAITGNVGIDISSNGTIKINDNKYFIDANQNIYYGEQTLTQGDIYYKYAAALSGNTLVPAYKVTFDAGDGQFEDESSTSVKGVAATGTAKVTAPTPAPTLDGKIITGWYTDAGCTDNKKFSFSSAITADTTLYAKWAEVTLTKVPAKAETCTATGNKEYYKGSDDKYYTLADGVYTETTLEAVTTAKLGHNFKNGKCTRCGAADPNYSGGKTPSRPTYPTGGGSATTPTKTNEPKIEGGNGASGWGNISSEIGKTPEGGSVVIDMGGVTTVPANVLTAVKGKDVDLILDMGEGIKWTINGKDISSVSVSIDLGVKIGTSDVPVDVVNNVTGEKYSTTLHLNHSGAFGFKAVMTLPLRRQDAGLFANLFYYNPLTKALEFVSSAVIDANGNADLDFNHASDYAIIIDDHSLDNPQFTAAVDGSSVKLTWDAVSGAANYNVYVAKNGKWSKLATTKKTTIDVLKLKNNKTYNFLVRAKVNGKLIPVSESYKLTVKVCYKPVLKATTKNGAITLKWSAVNNATEYRVVKSVNGEWKKVKTTSKTSLKISDVKSGNKYKYAVQAKVNGKWTTIGKASTATVKAK